MTHYHESPEAINDLGDLPHKSLYCFLPALLLGLVPTQRVREKEERNKKREKKEEF